LTFVFRSRSAGYALALAGAALLALAVATPAGARLTIKASERRGVVAMGKFHPRRSATLRSAIRAFGKPTGRRVQTGGNSCRVRWRRLGLIIQFANFGIAGQERTACDDDVGLAQTATIKGRRVRRWRTGRGLRGGDTRDRLEDLYPNAEQHGRRWWLVSAESPFGTGGRYAILAAGVTRGRVRDFHLSIGAAGE
jgi:hypothetical protein